MDVVNIVRRYVGHTAFSIMDRIAFRRLLGFTCVQPNLRYELRGYVVSHI